MSEKTRTYVKAVVIVTALLLVWWYLRRPQTVQQQAQADPWSSPFFQTNPGINNQITWYAAQQPPAMTSNNTLNYYNGQIQGLSNQYIPLFGLVGMTAVSA